MHADGIEQPRTEGDSRRDSTVQISSHGLTIQSLCLQDREVEAGNNPADAEYCSLAR